MDLFKIGDIVQINNASTIGNNMVNSSMVGQKGIIAEINDFGSYETNATYTLIFSSGLVREVHWRDVGYIGKLRDILK